MTDRSIVRLILFYFYFFLILIKKLVRSKYVSKLIDIKINEQEVDRGYNIRL